jgi:hypothetical protein
LADNIFFSNFEEKESTNILFTMKTFIKLLGILFILALAMPSMANAENHSIENHLSVSCADGIVEIE